MDLNYISDESGKKTAVIVPIEQWERLNKITNNEKKEKKKFSDFKGILSKQMAEKLLKHVEESRNEW